MNIQDKATLRFRMRELRKQLDPIFRASYSQQAVDALLASSLWKDAYVIAVYAPLPEELSLQKIWEKVWTLKSSSIPPKEAGRNTEKEDTVFDKLLLFPVCHPDEPGEMLFVPCEDIRHLRKGKYGIYEPCLHSCFFQKCSDAHSDLFRALPDTVGSVEKTGTVDRGGTKRIGNQKSAFISFSDKKTGNSRLLRQVATETATGRQEAIRCFFDLCLCRPELLKRWQPDIILVPGVAFGLDGSRLGMGAGYYDRLLGRETYRQAVRIGMGFSFQVVPSIPQDPWDCRLDFLCTEQGLIRTDAGPS